MFGTHVKTDWLYVTSTAGTSADLRTSTQKSAAQFPGPNFINQISNRWPFQYHTSPATLTKRTSRLSFTTGYRLHASDNGSPKSRRIPLPQAQQNPWRITAGGRLRYRTSSRSRPVTRSRVKRCPVTGGLKAQYNRSLQTLQS